MTVKQNHQHVSPNGLCYLPYIHEWGPNSHLVGLVEIASSVFSIEPPLFAKPPGATVVSTSSAVAQSAQYGATAGTRSSPAQYPAAARTTPVAMAATAASPVSAQPVVATAYNSSAYESYTPAMATASPVSAVAASSSSGALASPYAAAAATMATPATVAQISASMSSSSLRSEEEKRLQLIDQVRSCTPPEAIPWGPS
jgi:hypothetical protein